MKNKELRLGVNVDHIATIRQARGVDYPNPLEAALLCEEAGAGGITIHLREDRRHIQDADVYECRKKLKTPLNLEMANVPEIVDIALDAMPDEICQVPEKRMELTTEGGLDVAGLFNELEPTIKRMQDAGITVSLFIDPDRNQLEKAAELKAPYVELHTGSFCNAKDENAARKELDRLIDGARFAHEQGIKVNAGHGINMQTIDSILEIPFLDTLNIGHSIIARATLIGIKAAVGEMLNAMKRYTGGRA